MGLGRAKDEEPRMTDAEMGDAWNRIKVLDEQLTALYAAQSERDALAQRMQKELFRRALDGEL